MFPLEQTCKVPCFENWQGRAMRWKSPQPLICPWEFISSAYPYFCEEEKNWAQGRSGTAVPSLLIKQMAQVFSKLRKFVLPLGQASGICILLSNIRRELVSDSNSFTNELRQTFDWGSLNSQHFHTGRYNCLLRYIYSRTVVKCSVRKRAQRDSQQKLILRGVLKLLPTTH